MKFSTVWCCIKPEMICTLISVSDVHLKDINGSTLLHHLMESATDVVVNEKYPVLEAIVANKEFMPYWAVADNRAIKPLNE